MHAYKHGGVGADPGPDVGWLWANSSPKEQAVAGRQHTSSWSGQRHPQPSWRGNWSSLLSQPNCTPNRSVRLVRAFPRLVPIVRMSPWSAPSFP